MAYDLYYDSRYIAPDLKHWPDVVKNNFLKAPPHKLFMFKPLNKVVVVLDYHMNGVLTLFASHRVNEGLSVDEIKLPEECGFTIHNDEDGDLIIRNAFVEHLEEYSIPSEKLESFGTAWVNYAH